MTPYQFGYKFAAAPLAQVKQPMEKAIASQAKAVPSMLNMTRASGVNPIKVVNQIEQNVKVRTGQFPNTWETTEALMSGLPYPYPKK